MAALTIRKLEEGVKARLRIRAAHNGRSMEEEARAILGEALGKVPRSGSQLVASIRAKVEPLGGLDFELPSRKADRSLLRFEE